MSARGGRGRQARIGARTGGALAGGNGDAVFHPLSVGQVRPPDDGRIRHLAFTFRHGYGDGMRLSITRDSVAMGDDALAPHLVEIDLGRRVTVAVLGRWLRRSRYLASVHGGSTWVVRAEGVAIAVVWQPDPSLRFGRGGCLPIGEGDALVRASAVHVDYALTADPTSLAHRLGADPLQPTPREYG